MSTSSSRALLAPAALLTALVAACGSLAPAPGPLGLVEGRLRPCPGTPNCVSSQETVGVHAIEPLRFEGEPQAAFDSLVAFLRSEPRVELVTLGEGYVHAVWRTRLLRFADDVELLLDAEEGLIHVRSASRVGLSDLGANRARVESIRARWRWPAVPGDNL